MRKCKKIFSKRDFLGSYGAKTALNCGGKLRATIYRFSIWRLAVSWLRRTESLGKLRKLANLGKILLKLTNLLNLPTVYFANG